jgi:hypothetical protein
MWTAIVVVEVFEDVTKVVAEQVELFFACRAFGLLAEGAVRPGNRRLAQSSFAAKVGGHPRPVIVAGA